MPKVLLRQANSSQENRRECTIWEMWSACKKDGKKCRKCYLLVTQEPFESTEAAIMKENDIHSELTVVQRVHNGEIIEKL